MLRFPTLNINQHADWWHPLSVGLPVSSCCQQGVLIWPPQISCNVFAVFLFICRVYLLSTVVWHSLVVDRDLHLSFINCTGAFGGVRHVTVVEMLAGLQINGRDLGLMENTCRKWHASMEMDTQVGRCRPVGRGVWRDVCCFQTVVPYVVKI